MTSSKVCLAEKFQITEETKKFIEAEMNKHQAMKHKKVSGRNASENQKLGDSNLIFKNVAAAVKDKDLNKNDEVNALSRQVVVSDESEDKSDDEIDVTIEDNNRMWVKIGKFTLKAVHKNTLISGEWLNDYHINCAQTLLKQQFPSFGGLYSMIGQGKHFKRFPKDQDALQILFVAGNHWIAATTVNNIKDKEVLLYDSLYSTVTDEIKILLSQLIYTKHEHFVIKMANVIKQSGVSDCGVFVIAYITHIAFGLNPSLCVFAQSQM